MKFVAYGFGE